MFKIFALDSFRDAETFLQIYAEEKYPDLPYADIVRARWVYSLLK